MSAPQKFVEAVPRLTSYFRWPTDMDVGLVVPTTRHYAFSVIRKPVCSAVRVFLALQVPRNFRRPLTLRSRQAHLQRVPQLRRLCTHNEQRSRVLLCRDAFAAYCLTRTAYCGTAFTSYYAYFGVAQCSDLVFPGLQRLHCRFALSLPLYQNRVQNLNFPGPLGPRIPGPEGQIPSSFFPCFHGVHDLVLSITDQRVSCTPP
jgi:hypothetical protein